MPRGAGRHAAARPAGPGRRRAARAATGAPALGVHGALHGGRAGLLHPGGRLPHPAGAHAAGHDGRRRALRHGVAQPGGAAVRQGLPRNHGRPQEGPRAQVLGPHRNRLLLHSQVQSQVSGSVSGAIARYVTAAACELFSGATPTWIDRIKPVYVGYTT